LVVFEERTEQVDDVSIQRSAFICAPPVTWTLIWGWDFLCGLQLERFGRFGEVAQSYTHGEGEFFRDLDIARFAWQGVQVDGIVGAQHVSQFRCLDC